MDFAANMKNTWRMCECTRGGGEGSLTARAFVESGNRVWMLRVELSSVSAAADRWVKGATFLFKVEKMEHSWSILKC